MPVACTVATWTGDRTATGDPTLTLNPPSPYRQGEPEEDFTKLTARRSVFEDRLRQLEEHTDQSLSPRQFVNLMRACIVGRREKLGEFLPRVVGLHPRVSGGTKDDGTAVLAALSYVGSLKSTFAEYERLKKENIKSYELNYGYLVEAASKKGDLDRAFSVVPMMRQDRQFLVEGKPSTFVFNRLILACGERKAMHRAFHVFQLLRGEGLRPTRTTFACFADACAMSGDLNKGLTVLSQLKPILGFADKKYVLDARYFTSLIPACKAPEDFDRIVAELIREGIKPTEDTLSALIVGCTSNGGLSRALKMFQELRLFHEVTDHQQQQEQNPKEGEKRRTVVPKPSLGSIYF